MTGGADARATNRAPLALLAVIIVTGAAVRLLFTGARGLRIDEAVSWGIARMPWPTFIKVVTTAEANMIAYYVPLRAWLHLGETEFAIRFLSVVFGVLALPAIYRLGTRLFGRREGVIAAALLAAHPFHVHFSQDARAYSLVVFLVIVSTDLFVRALQSPARARAWTAYALVAGLSVYAHVFALLVLLSHAMVFLAHRRRHAAAAIPRGAALLLAFLIAPMVAFLATQNKGRLGWVPHPTPEHLTRILNDLAGSDTAAAAVLALAAITSVLLLRPRRAGAPGGDRSARDRGPALLLVLWFAVPFVVSAAFSAARPILVSRYLLMCVPALVLLLARGATLLAERARFGRAAAIVAGALLLGVFAAQMRDDTRKRIADRNEWAPAARHILAGQREGDAALVYFWSNRYLIEYYARRAAERGGAALTPRFIFPYADGAAPPARRGEVTREEWERISRDAERIWLVAPAKLVRAGLRVPASDDGKLGSIRARLEEGFACEESVVFEGDISPLVVELYTREALPPAR
ncbi:MAG: glycosyltransferase family 39 protein [bacterium]